MGFANVVQDPRPSTLGFPCIGSKRELKAALEEFWSGTAAEEKLLAQASRVRTKNWLTQRRLGIPQKSDRACMTSMRLESHQLGKMAGLGRKARERFASEQIWVDPDCGLKTRKWKEIELALRNMVQAAKQMRQAESTQQSAAPCP
jgi:hypothetical protein